MLVVLPKVRDDRFSIPKVPPKVRDDGFSTPLPFPSAFPPAQFTSLDHPLLARFPLPSIVTHGAGAAFCCQSPAQCHPQPTKAQVCPRAYF